MAQEVGISDGSVRNIVKKKLRLRPYKIQKSHLLTEKMKQVRHQKSKEVSRRFGRGAHRTSLFSDEKLFTIEETFNKQNARVLTPNISVANAAGRITTRSTHPASIMVWAGITAEGKIPSVFTDQGVKIDKKLYRQQILEATVEPWARLHFGDRQWAFQLHSAPAHKAKTTQAWCRDNFPCFISSAEWPSYSPDLNPLDYSILSVLEVKACTKRHKSLEELKRSHRAAWDQIDNHMLRAIVDNFPKRLKACVKAKGGYFENC